MWVDNYEWPVGASNQNFELKTSSTRGFNRRWYGILCEQGGRNIYQQSSFFYRSQTKFAKVMFLHVSIIMSTGRACVGGVCMAGGVRGRGHAWQGVRGRGACVAGGGHVCQILRDTVNEWAVRILLECILVVLTFSRICPISHVLEIPVVSKEATCIQ